jgi:hypothetical protein
LNTFVLLDLPPGGEDEETLKLLVYGQLQQSCPVATCLVAAYAPGYEEQDLHQMLREVDERSLLTMESPATTERHIEHSVYVAVRSLPFEVGATEPYELGLLLMVFRMRDRVLRRYTIPDYVDDTPPSVPQMLGKQLRKTGRLLSPAMATREESVLTGAIADAVVSGFADFYRRESVLHN